MASETKVLTAHIPLALANRVEAMASRLERSRGWVMKQALAAWVDLEEERHRMTLEALEDVDAGRVIDHRAILAWAESLGSDAPLPAPGR
jgi:predicted transcriptional regulator